MKVGFLFVLFLTGFLSFSQKQDYAYAFISDSLKQNANAVVRLDYKAIKITSQRDMSVKCRRVVTVLNEKGINAINATEYYNRSKSIKNIEAVILDASGNEIKKIRRKDFEDYSVAGGSMMFSDYRVVSLNYTPIQYPFTIIYDSEISTSSTAFIPIWMPLTDYLESVEKSVLQVTCPENLGFRKKEFNFEFLTVKKEKDTPTELIYSAENISARKYEPLSPGFGEIFPKVMMGLEFFHLEGVDGAAKNWKEFGQWYTGHILKGTADLPEATKLKMKSLVGTETDPIKKARIVYDFVQRKSRYVSIQVGIGGWKPMLASDVDRLGYGDCKALSNYTRALLDAVNVPSYNVLLYGDKGKNSIQTDFVSMQGNHMILAIPDQNNYVFLECTSQDDPFGYQAGFTDDRDVLVMKPDNAEIAHAKIYTDKNNSQISKGFYKIAPNAGFSGSVSIVSEGTQYGNKTKIENQSATDREAYYKNYWSNINNLKLQKTSFSNDKEKVSFTEDIIFEASNYGSLTGNKIIFPINGYNRYEFSLKRVRSRKMPFEVSRGFYDEDEIAIELPEGFSVESLPKDFEVSEQFGTYKTAIVKMEENKFLYKRSLYIKTGRYAKDQYESYRLFTEKITKNDNAKIILTKINN